MIRNNKSIFKPEYAVLLHYQKMLHFEMLKKYFSEVVEIVGEQEVRLLQDYNNLIIHQFRYWLNKMLIDIATEKRDRSTDNLTRKTDKYRLIEGRGIGRGLDYHPWIESHEFSPKSWCYKILGWKIRRIHQLFSKRGELYYFLCRQWEDDVVDIREQYPLTLDQTIVIANELCIRHPSIVTKLGNVQEIVMTTDFVITRKNGDLLYDEARDFKMSNMLDKKRTANKFRIVKRYWEKEGINWGIVTEHEVNEMKGYNLFLLYNDYFWAEKRKLFGDELSKLIFKFKDKLIQNGFDVYRTTDDFDVANGWPDGESLRLFKYLLVKKEILTDFNKRLDFENMEIWLTK